MARTKHVVTMVHGTYPGRAAWTHEGSLLRQAIEQKCGESVRITRIDWGVWNNSQAARLQGADILAQHIKRSAVTDPESRHLVIAHSHGGNVALYAMRDPEVQRLVDGIVFIGTPFIICETRSFKRLWLAVIVAGGMLVFLPAAWLINACFSLYWSVWQHGLPVSGNSFNLARYAFWDNTADLLLKGPLFLFVIFVLEKFLGFSKSVAKDFGEVFSRLPEALASRYESPALAGTPYTCYSVTGDEAGVLLHVIQVTHDILPNLLFPSLLFVGSIAGLVLGIRGMLRGFVPRNFDWLSFFMQHAIFSIYYHVWFYLLFVTAITVLLVTALVIAAALRDSPAGYGSSSPWIGWLIRLRVEPTPTCGDHGRVFKLRLLDLAMEQGWSQIITRRAHSLLCYSPAVADDIATQIGYWLH